MRIITTFAAGLGLGLLAAPALAGDMPNLYPYPVAENYCPSGLQPVVMNGVICCGKPNTHVTYRQMMRHPVRTSQARSYSARAGDCPVGAKGCS